MLKPEPYRNFVYLVYLTCLVFTRSQAKTYFFCCANVFAVFTVLEICSAAAVQKRGEAVSLDHLIERATEVYTLPQNSTDPGVRAAALASTRLGFTYGSAVAGGPYYPSGALGAARAAADGVAIQLEVVPEGALAATDSAAATADGLLDKYNGLKTVDDYTLLYKGEWKNTLPKGPVPGILSNYSQDLLFSMERLSNSPYAVRRLNPSIDTLAFDVDAAVAEQVSGSSLQGLFQTGRLFYLDHSAQGKLARTPGRYAPACDAYFYISEAAAEFLPLAIRTGVGANLIYTPHDDAADWLLAKMMFNVNDSWFVNWYHLASTHEVVQIVWMAAIRSLSVYHPVYALLDRLMYQVFAIQPIAASILFNPGGTVDQIFGYTGAAAQEFTTNLYLDGGGDFQSNYFLTNLQSRGLINSTFGPELAHFPFYEDASVIHTAIKEFMTTFVESYYPSASVLQSDTELQAWATEANGPAKVLGFPQSILSTDTLIDILTHMAHLVSTAHHTSNTNDLLSLTGTLPLHPAALYQPLPTTKLNTTSIVDFLPPLDKCLAQFAFSALFARPLLAHTNRSLLHMFDDPVLLAGLNAETAAEASAFEERMRWFSGEVGGRQFDGEGLAQGMPFVWTALDPGVAPYSITT